jgi:hypothetical protein
MKNIIKDIFNKEGSMSSKRVFGGVAIISAVVMAFTGVDVEILQSFLWTGTGLLGVSIATEITKEGKRGEK